MNPPPTVIENSENNDSMADESLETDTPQANETNESSSDDVAMATNSRERDQDLIEFICDLFMDFLINTITVENVQDSYKTAISLQLTDLCDACCEFMKNNLKPFCCLETLAFANINGCEELLIYAKEYVIKNFWQIVKHDEFLTLSPGGVEQLISSKLLSTLPDEIILESIISWVKFDLQNRFEYLDELTEYIGIPPLSGMESIEPPNKSKVLLVIGSWSHTASVIYDECYDFIAEKWRQVSEEEKTLYGTNLAFIEKRIYKMGNHSNNKIDVYDSFTRKWLKCKYMTSPRIAFGIAVLDDCIYVVGGNVFGKTSNAVEIYDPRENEWQMIPSMLKKRGLLGVGVVNGFIYAIGGYDWESKKYLSSAERYNPETKKWESIADMSISRGHVGIGVIDDILYAVGGRSGVTVLQSVEAYNPKTNEWKLVAEMSECRAGAGVVVYNEMLYVVGGGNGTHVLPSVEIFSPPTNSWTTLPSSMKIGRFHAGVAIVDKLQAPPAITLN